MALQKQIKQLVFEKGLDTRTNPDLVPIGTLHALENAQFKQRGKISKKNGSVEFSTTIATTEFQPYSGALPAARSGFTHKSSLLAVVPGVATADPQWQNSQDLIYNRALTSNKWAYTARAAHCSAESHQVGIQGSKTATSPYLKQGVGSIDVAYVNGYIVSATQTNTVGTSYVDFIDAKTNEVVLSQTIAVGAPKIVQMGTAAIVMGQIGTNIKGFLFDTTNLATVPAANIITFAVNVGPNNTWDCMVSSFNSLLYIAHLNTTPGLTVASYALGAIPAGGGFAGTTAVFTDATDTPYLGFAIFGGESVHQHINVVYAKAGVGTRLRILTMALANVSVATIYAYECVAISGSSFLYDTVNNRGLIVGEFTDSAVEHVGNFQHFYWNAAGATPLTYKTARPCRLSLASKLIKINGYVYQLIVHPNGSERTFFLVMHPLDTSGNVGQLRPMAKLLFGEAGLQNSFYVGLQAMMPQLTVGAVSTQFYCGGTRFAQYLDSTTFASTPQWFLFDLADPRAYQAREIANLTYLNGGFPAVYDGGDFYEAQFLHSPWAPSGLTAGAAGSLTPSTTYSVITLFEYVDSNGNRHQSAPSLPASVTLGGAQNSISLTVYAPSLSCHNTVTLSIYRTEGNGTIYYREKSLQLACTATPTTTTLTIADSVLIQQEILYTSGNVIDNQCPVATKALTAWKNRIWCLTDSGLNYSKEVTDGVPAAFNPVFTIDIGASKGTPTAIAALQDKLIIFFKDQIYYISGDGPDATGTVGSFTPIELVAPGIGCVESSGIVEMADQVLFHSRDGWRRINQALVIDFIGSELQYWVNEDSVTYSAQHVDPIHEVRISDGARTFVYDTYGQQWIINTVWDDKRGFYWTAADGSRKWVRVTSTGKMGCEVSTSTADIGVSYPRLRVTTGWISMDQFEGFQRIYEVQLLLRNLTGDGMVYVDVFYDYVYELVETHSQAVFGPVWAESDIYATAGAATPFPPTSPMPIYRIQPAVQKCSAIRLEISDGTTGLDTYALELSGLNFVIGVKALSNRQTTWGMGGSGRPAFVP